jgi:hypothetical protein
MGVRFQCPNGHNLHVKTELAGKRGICPECGAKFVVPSFSGGRVPVDTGAPSGVSAPPASARPTPSPPPTTTPPPSLQSASPAESILIQTQPPPPPPQLAATPAAAGATNHEAVAWYVRPASGGQFGPATAEVLQQWIEDGRVAADSWVWRTGWTDWKAGSEAVAALADPKMTAMQSAEGVLGASPLSNVELNSAEARRREIKRRKQRMRTISTVLALVALLMLSALVFVLTR